MSVPHDELITLLARRDSGNANWDRLWELLHQTLGRLRPGILRSLREAPEDILQGFIVEKLVEKNYDFPSFAKLVSAYMNYLTDIYRRDQHRLLVDDVLTSENDEGESVIERIPSDEDVPQNVGRHHLMQSAAHFFEQLEEDAKRYLGQSMCAEDGMALHKLAERYKIANYHKRARALGVIQNKQALTTADYGSTRIGRWITQTLNIRLDPENWDEISDAIHALCACALHWANGQQPADR